MAALKATKPGDQPDTVVLGGKDQTVLSKSFKYASNHQYSSFLISLIISQFVISF
jgi:hypothetical protein